MARQIPTVHGGRSQTLKNRPYGDHLESIYVWGMSDTNGIQVIGEWGMGGAIVGCLVYQRDDAEPLDRNLGVCSLLGRSGPSPVQGRWASERYNRGEEAPPRSSESDRLPACGFINRDRYCRPCCHVDSQVLLGPARRPVPAGCSRLLAESSFPKLSFSAS